MRRLPHRSASVGLMAWRYSCAMKESRLRAQQDLGGNPRAAEDQSAAHHPGVGADGAVIRRAHLSEVVPRPALPSRNARHEASHLQFDAVADGVYPPFSIASCNAGTWVFRASNVTVIIPLATSPWTSCTPSTAFKTSTAFCTESASVKPSVAKCAVSMDASSGGRRSWGSLGSRLIRKKKKAAISTYRWTPLAAPPSSGLLLES